MSAKFVFLSNTARKHGLKLPKWIKSKLEQALIEIKTNPLAGTPLQGKLKDTYKYRIGDYRIVYSFSRKSKTVLILKIEHRQGVYR